MVRKHKTLPKFPIFDDIKNVIIFTFVKFFIPFVRPHLEYGQLIWAPSLKHTSIYFKTYSVVLPNLQIDTKV